MAQLSWDNVGERYFEAGVDRGVLYTTDGSGVAWNGLIGVTETPSGGEATPYYADGVKYLNLAGLEDFGGTIEAYTYPDEFAIHDGTVMIGGLGVHQQRRKPFGLSYRTLIGNDVEAQDHAYKIHLIYNALAEPSGKSFTTLGEETDPLNFSWTFSTTTIRPTSVANVAPLSHVTIDSRKTYPAQLRLIEEALYGTASQPPRLLSLDEVFELFENPSYALLIDPNQQSGLANLIDSGTAEGDLIGQTTKGIYSAPIETRLVETDQPGLYVLE